MSSAPDTAVPRLIKFSGMLKDRKGEAKTGVVAVTFAIYADQEGGIPLWMETQNVQLDEGGRYTALLGANSNEGVPLDLFSTGQTRWLGVESLEIELPPRVLLVSVPYALKAADAETLAGMPASAFLLASPQGVSSNGANKTTEGSAQAGVPVPPKTQAVNTTSKIASSQTKAAKSSAAKSAATAPVDNDFVAKFDPTDSLVPSAIFESNGNVGIGTTSPLTPLQVNGNILLTGQTVHNVQVSGVASSGRFGQDLLGTFLASDSAGSSLRFLTNNGSLNEWMRIGNTGSVNIGSAQAAQFGEAVFAPDNLDTVHSVIGQAGSQYHFRLSRATPDSGGFKDFLISPYTYGMAIEYPGTLESWSYSFSVHFNPRCPPIRCGPGANLWVGDEIDSGGLWANAVDGGGGNASFVRLAADRFNHTSHGSLNFIVRNTTDAFKFDVGPFGSEVMKGQISATASASSLDLFSGTVQATVRAQSGSPTGVELGSTSNDALSLFTNNGAAQVTLFPSGNLSIGNASDTAPLAVGTAAQFQVSSAGATTIGGGTAITRHISVSTSLAFPEFSRRSCNTLSVTATGAADGDSVALGIPNALASIDELTWFGWVSAPGVVSVRGCNVTNQTMSAPPTVNLRVDVWQH
ncbi:MAG: hypothetical protein ACHQLQ_04440 [Candidatus Acidiferrales bacterium]